MIRPHINLEVSDLEASIAFYSGIFDVEPTKRKTDYANFRLNDPALHLALVEKPDKAKKPEGGGEHFGFELFSQAQLETWKERIRQAGIQPYLEEEDVTCCYAVANKFWLQDPDGNQWEFWVKTDDNGATLFSSNEATACCTESCSA